MIVDFQSLPIKNVLISKVFQIKILNFKILPFIDFQIPNYFNGKILIHKFFQ